MRSLQFLEAGLYEAAFASILQSILKGIFRDFNSHIYLERPVAHRSLNGKVMSAQLRRRSLSHTQRGLGPDSVV